jgi:hypothetical protein
VGSRLDEPGGVGWKDVSGGHSLTIISSKQLGLWVERAIVE